MQSPSAGYNDPSKRTQSICAYHMSRQVYIRSRRHWQGIVYKFLDICYLDSVSSMGQRIAMLGRALTPRTNRVSEMTATVLNLIIIAHLSCINGNLSRYRSVAICECDRSRELSGFETLEFFDWNEVMQCNAILSDDPCVSAWTVDAATPPANTSGSSCRPLLRYRVVARRYLYEVEMQRRHSAPSPLTLSATEERRQCIHWPEPSASSTNV